MTEQNGWNPLTHIDGNKAGVYEIRCTVNGRVYVGQSGNIQARIARHVENLSASAHHNAGMQADWNEYGTPSFECRTVRILPRAAHELRRQIESSIIAKLADANVPIYNTVTGYTPALERPQYTPPKPDDTNATRNRIYTASIESTDAPDNRIVTCYDCGKTGDYPGTFYVWENEYRCSTCVDLAIDTFNNLFEVDQVATKNTTQLIGSVNRWQFEPAPNKERLTKFVTLGITQHKKLYKSAPQAVFVNVDAPTVTLENTVVKKRKSTPSGYVDTLI